MDHQGDNLERMSKSDKRRIRIFVSSAEDTDDERNEVQGVVAGLQTKYDDCLKLEVVRWEHMHLDSGASFQTGIEKILSADDGIDLAVFIFWARFGHPPGGSIRRQDDSEYASAMEREWDLMFEAQAKPPARRPTIFTFIRKDNSGFIDRMKDRDSSALFEMLQQRENLKTFLGSRYTAPSAAYGVETNRRAYAEYSSPVDFADQLRDHLDSRLKQIRRDMGLAAANWQCDIYGSPFRSLEVFEYEHRALFFGRDQEIADVRKRLHRRADAGCAFVLLVGDSGSGKSSLARAGVAPAMVECGPPAGASEWRRAIFAPQGKREDLFGSFVAALTERTALPELAAEDAGLLAKQLEADPSGTFYKRIKPLLENKRLRLLLIFDQIEELFTGGKQLEAARGRLGELLGVLAQSGSVYVLGTLRIDHYASFQKVPEFAALKKEDAQVDVKAPGVSDLRQIITQPAAAAGLFYGRNENGEALNARLLDDAAENPEVLPLLEFCLDLLYQKQEARRDRELSLADYEALKRSAPDGPASAISAESGLAGVLAGRADEIFENLSIPAADRDRCFRAIFGKLFDLPEDGGKTPVRKYRTWTELVQDPRGTDSGRNLPGAEKFLEAFTDSRLLVASGQGEDQVYRVAHEALLRNWWRLREFRAQEASYFHVRPQLAQHYADWLSDGQRDTDLLPDGNRFVLATKMLTEAPELLLPKIREYIHLSERRVNRKKRFQRRVAFGVIAILLALLLIAFRAARSERAQKQEAEKQTSIAQKQSSIADHTTTFLIDMFKQADPAESQGRDVMASEVLDRASASIQDAFPGESDVECRIQVIIATIDRYLGKYESAFSHADAALRLAENLYHGTDHADLANALNEEGCCLQVRSHADLALPKLEAALNMRRRLYPGNHPDVATSLSNVAFCLQALDRRDEARPKFEEALAMRQNLFKGDSDAVASSLNHLAGCLQGLKHPENALPLYKQALAMRQQLHKGDYPDVATSLNNVACCLQLLKHPDEALPLHREALAMRQRLYKNAHPEVAESLNNVATCLLALKHFDESLDRFKDTLAMQRGLQEGDSLGTASALNNVGFCLQTLGRSDQALQNYEEALAMRLRLYKADHSLVANSYLNLGDCLHRLKRSADALMNYTDGKEMLMRLHQKLEVAVNKVPPGGRAEKLGLHINDVIVRYGNEDLFTQSQFGDLNDQFADKDVGITILRDGKTFDLGSERSVLDCGVFTRKEDFRPGDGK